MRRWISIVTFLLNLTFILPLAAQERPTVEKQIESLTRARDLLFERRYDEAEFFLKNLIKEWPEELFGHFALLSLYQVRNFENYDYRFDPPYLGWEKKAREMAWKTAKKESSTEPWDLLVAGGTLGITGLYRGHNHKWFAAMRDSSAGFHAIKKALEKDPELTEALFGVGLYNYWRSHFTKKIKFLPFFDDRRERGKEELKKAARQGQFVDVLAKVSLAYIDYQEKSYDKVLTTVNDLLKRYPQNTILRMLRGDTLVQMKKYQEAIAEFDKILAIDPNITKSYLFKGIAYAREGKSPNEARQYIEKFLDAEPQATPDWLKLADRTLKELSEKKAVSAESDR